MRYLNEGRSSGELELSACYTCEVSDRCGGCAYLSVPYEEQLELKRRAVEGLFSDIAPGVRVKPVSGMETPLHYRNKVTSPFAPAHSSKGVKRKAPDARGKRKGKDSRARGRRVLCGMYAKGTHDIVPTDDCLIENETGKAVVLAVRDLMQKWDIAPYDEDSGTGFMRHAIVRAARSSGEVLVTLVANSEDFPNSKSFARELKKRVPEITSIVHNINLRKTNVVLGERERVLFGPGFILDNICGLSVRISSQSFYQVNSVQTDVLYSRAIDMAELTGKETVLDAYCGAGVIGLVAAKRGAARVIGVECVGSAVEDAMQNAKHNGISNASFAVADATDFMMEAAAGERPELAGCAGGEDLVLMMDPPRAGATEEFLHAASRLRPSRIVYISCDPKTQARDVRYLVAHGYEVREIQPVDMFPHTDHIENIVSLARR